MDNEDFTSETPGSVSPTHRRPLGYWLRVVDGLLTREFATAFEGEDVSRRDWMLLNALSGDVELPGLADRIARKGKRLKSLADRGWIVEADGTWTLTDEGHAAKERLGAIVDGVRTRVAGAVSPEDFATTMTSLEAIARELGWDESDPHAGGGFGRFRGGRRGFGPFGPRHGFGPGFDPDGDESAAPRHGFGPRGGFRPGFRPGFGPDGGPHDGPCGGHHPHGHGRHHGRKGHGRDGERAYERGFDAGFARGKAAQDA